MLPLLPGTWPPQGFDLFHLVTVGDNQGRAAEALSAALGRADVVITTGGLGPTADDVTREAAAQANGRELVFVPELMAQIEAFFRARGLPPSSSNRKQAYIPRGSVPLPNPVGTAPCFIVEQGDQVLISLPGVPREMAGMGDPVHALVTGDEGAARRFGVDDSAGGLAQAVRDWAKTDLGAAVVIGIPRGAGPSLIYPTRIGVATPEGLTQHDYRFGGDPRQVRVRAHVMTLDRLRRVLMPQSD